MVYFGKHGKRYEQGTAIKSGGEGTVYTIANDRQSVMKLYHGQNGGQMTPNERNQKRAKIEAMLNSGIEPYLPVLNHGKPTGRKILSVAWPTDLVVDSSGTFHGFVMPRVEGRQSLVVACSEEDRSKLLFMNGYTWRQSVSTACNLAIMVNYLHQQDIVIGDMNANNIMVQSESLVTLIDADSFTVKDRTGKVFKCMVGLPETEPPEIQGRDMSKDRNQFTVYSDRFALSIHIWNLLCNNFHPFNVPRPITGNNSTSGGANIQVDNIVKGYCPYMSGNRQDLPRGAPNPKMLPNDIMNLFRRVFLYNEITASRPETRYNRPSAAEWIEALQKLLYHTPLSWCHEDNSHIYPSAYGGICPWCEAAGKFRPRRHFQFW